MEGKFLSFIVPVYNAERYLSQCLDSLLHQDIPRERYEILCIDDGCTDGSTEILQAYQKQYPFIRVMHKGNSGVATARNIGMYEAKGEYLWFVDADDFVQENILGKLQALAERTSCDRIVLGAYSFADALTPAEQEQARQNSLPCNAPWEDSVVWRSLLRLEFLNSHGLYFRYPELTHGEDGLFMYEVSMEHPQTEVIPDMDYFYRVHSSSAETTATIENHDKRLRSYLRITEILYDYYQSGRKDAETANKLTTFLRFTLFEAAALPASQAAETLNKLQGMGLYPSRPLPECTLEHAYMTQQKGLTGKVLDKLCMNLQTRWGYTGIRFAFWVKKLLKK